MSIFTDVWHWLKKELSQAEEFTVDHIAPLAISIGEEVKILLDNKLVVNIIDILLDKLKLAKVNNEVIALILLNADRLIAFGLILEAPPINSTPEEKTAWSAKLFSVWTTNQHLINRAQFFTIFSAQLAQIIEAGTQTNQTKFAYWANAAEQAWTKYQEDLKQF